MRQPGFFDLDERYQRLSESGDPLVKLGALVDFELFRSRLNAAPKRSDDAKGARPMTRCYYPSRSQSLPKLRAFVDFATKGMRRGFKAGDYLPTSVT